MSDPNPQGFNLPTEVSLTIAAVIAAVVKTRLAKRRSLMDVAMDAFATAGLVYLAFTALVSLPERWGGPVPEGVAVAGATVIAVIGWEGIIRVVRRIMGL